MSRDRDSEQPDELPKRQRWNRKSGNKTSRASTPRSRRNRRRRWPLILVLLGMFLFFAPNLVGWLGLQHYAINYALRDFVGTVSARQATFGWFQPVEIGGVSATDPEGNLMFEAAEVRSSKSLLAFLVNSELGQFELVQPVIHLKLRAGGSNLEDALAKYLAPDPNGPQPIVVPKFELKLSDGQVVVESTATGSIWKIDQLNLVAETRTDVAPLVFGLKCRLAQSTPGPAGESQFGESGTLGLSGQMDPGSPELIFESAHLELEALNAPVSIIGPALERVATRVATAGVLNGKISVAFDARGSAWSAEADRLNVVDFRMVAPEWLGQDQIQIQTATLQGGLRLDGLVVSAHQFDMKTDVGWVKADGRIDVKQISAMASQRGLLDTPFQIDGEVDLARLIPMLPSTFQLHRDLVVHSGTLSLQANSRKEDGVRRMIVNLDTINLQAQRGNQRILWAKPFRVVASVRDVDGQIAIENVQCTSDFLTIRGHGNRDTASFAVRGDLSKLMNKIGQFVELQGARLEGTIDGHFGWEAGSIDARPGTQSPVSQLASPRVGVKAIGSFDIENPMIAIPGMPVWQKPKLSIKASASGWSTDQSLWLQQAGFQADVGSERLTVTLSGPVADVASAVDWRFKCQASGSLSEWISQIGNFVALPEISTEGAVTLTSDLMVDSRALRFTGLEYRIDQLAFDGFGMRIREPQTTGSGALYYDWESGNIEIPEFVLVSSSLSARCQPIRISFDPNLRVDGNVSFRADVNRVTEWVSLSPTPESLFWFGSTEGTIELVANENGIGGRVRTMTKNLIAARQVTVRAQPNQAAGTMRTVAQPTREWQEVFRESSVGMSGDISFTNEFDSIRFHQFVLDSEAVKVSADGTVSDLQGVLELDVAGNWNPNWEKMNYVLASTTNGKMKFAGQKDQPFSILGPVFQTRSRSGSAAGQVAGSEGWLAPTLRAAIGLGWERGEVLGLPVGASELEMNLQQNVVTVKTQGIPLGGGKVVFAPRVELVGDRPMMVLNQTRVIDRVQLQPQTVRHWLRYMTPWLADTSSARGTFSVDVQTAHIPIFDLMQMEVQGSVLLSEVVVEAGPIARQLFASVEQIRSLLKPGSAGREMGAWFRIHNQSIPIVIRNGRMFHDNLKFSYNEIVIRTRGSVGLDQTLNLVAEVAIADDWIAGRPLLAGLKGRSLMIPITGTVKQPRLDLKAVQDFMRNYAKEAVGNVFNLGLDRNVKPRVNELQNELNGQLNRGLNDIQNKLFGK